EKSRATVFLRHRHPAARFTGNLPLGGLHGLPGARCLPRRTIMLLELAKSPSHGGPLPASTTNGTRRNAGIVERRFGLLATLCAAPRHTLDSSGRDGSGRRPESKELGAVSA